jgi:hypothetical protein
VGYLGKEKRSHQDGHRSFSEAKFEQRQLRGDMSSKQVSAMGHSSSDSDKGITTKARYLSSPGARSGNSPWKLGPSIVIVEIRDHIVICIEPDRFFETWPPIYRGQKRLARDRLRLSQLATSLFSTRTKFCLVCLNLYLRVHPTPSSPDSKSFIYDIYRVNPHQLAPTMGAWALES